MTKATQPCPCGMAGDPRSYCRCSSSEIVRYRTRQQALNAEVSLAMLRHRGALCTTCQDMLDLASEKFLRSERARVRMQRVARAIADLNGLPHIQPDDLAEALSF